LRVITRLQGEEDFAMLSRLRRERRMRLFQEADKETGGKLCENIDAIVKEEADFVQRLLEDAKRETITPPVGRGPIELKQVRTEVERLIDYLDFRHLCKGETS